MSNVLHACPMIIMIYLNKNVNLVAIACKLRNMKFNYLIIKLFECWNPTYVSSWDLHEFTWDCSSCTEGKKKKKTILVSIVISISSIFIYIMNKIVVIQNYVLIHKMHIEYNINIYTYENADKRRKGKENKS